MKKRIMIVEDEAVVAMSLCDLLDHWGYEVLPPVTSGEDAVERAALEKPDVILLDISLSGEVDGIEAAHKINSSVKIPVIFMTGYADEEIIEKAKEARPAGFFVKPVDLDRLKEKIESVVQNGDGTMVSQAKKHILMVDDRKDVLKPLAEGLKATGEFEVFTAENGKKALEIFNGGHGIDLLVTDIEMPVMDGFELLAHVKKDFPATPAIVLTGHITHRIKEQLKTIGDFVCIQKPVSFWELRLEIIDELRIHSARGEYKKQK
ncbi:MAG: response regulator [Nitrospiraceae bacterium]|nr:response regulator [Nitrospiraceae bacterium]